MVILGLVLGVAFVLPIGGADMPVVISLLNAFPGSAAAATGFVLGNTALTVAGALDGASGTLLTTVNATINGGRDRSLRMSRRRRRAFRLRRLGIKTELAPPFGSAPRPAR